MLKGALLAESLRNGAVFEVPDVTLTRVVRRDVSGSATSAQPSVWTFLEFEAADEVADQLAGALASHCLPRVAGTPTSRLATSTSWFSRVGSSVTSVVIDQAVPRPKRTHARWGSRHTKWTGAIEECGSSGPAAHGCPQAARTFPVPGTRSEPNRGFARCDEAPMTVLGSPPMQRVTVRRLVQAAGRECGGPG